MTLPLADEVFDALGDHTRRQLLRAIGDEPVAVGVLAERVAVGRPAVSKHLKVLQGAGLVSHHSVGTRNLYALAPEGYAVAQRWFADTWTAALTAFAGISSSRNDAAAPADRGRRHGRPRLRRVHHRDRPVVAPGAVQRGRGVPTTHQKPRTRLSSVRSAARQRDLVGIGDGSAYPPHA